MGKSIMVVFKVMRFVERLLKQGHLKSLRADHGLSEHKGARLL
jgi:hypothetical protein